MISRSVEALPADQLRLGQLGRDQAAELALGPAGHLAGHRVQRVDIGRHAGAADRETEVPAVVMPAQGADAAGGNAGDRPLAPSTGVEKMELRDTGFVGDECQPAAVPGEREALDVPGNISTQPGQTLFPRSM